jgi:PIN domain nuclease of toxin-antitoxin system
LTYLLDTGVVFWAMKEPRKLSGKARRICESPSAQRVVSVASLWEMIAKCAIGKMSIPNAETELEAWIGHLKVRILRVEAAHAYAMYGLPLLHKDPFDRMLVAQAQAEGLVLVTPDEDIHRYPSLKWVW